MISSTDLISLFTKIRIVINACGLVGNLLSFLVFSRKKFQKNSISVYCRSLAVTDSLIIGFVLANDIANLFFGVDLYSSLNSLCKISFIVYTAISSISSWFLVAFGLDKALSVIFHGKYEFVQKRSFQLSVIITIVLINLLVFIEVPIALNAVRIVTPIYETNQTQVYSLCAIQTISFVAVIDYLYLIFACIIPFIIMIATTIAISKELYRSSMRVMPQVSRELKERRYKDRKFAANSVILNIVYVVLQIPISLTYFLNISDPTSALLFALIALVLFCANYSISFFIYMTCNSVFRREVFEIICVRKEKTSIKKSKNQVERRTNQF